MHEHTNFSGKQQTLDSFVLSEWEKQQAYRKYVINSELRKRGSLF